ncbi:MAG TPA: type II toxin-antitoxin system CcdA family antitoxin [Actinomycetales bacterium]|nr:type II toxin-antitoxin system CcdA family antitoxin [Actinomycetales bacterium]
MARLNVYLPDELAAQVRAAGLNLSALTQDAVRRSLAGLSTDDWLAKLPTPSGQATHDQVMDALDAVREAPSTHHG